MKTIEAIEKLCESAAHVGECEVIIIDNLFETAHHWRDYARALEKVIRALDKRSGE